MGTQAACKDCGATTAIATPHEADITLVSLRLLNDSLVLGSVETIRPLDAVGLRFSNGTGDIRPVAATIGGQSDGPNRLSRPELIRKRWATKR